MNASTILRKSALTRFFAIAGGFSLAAGLLAGCSNSPASGSDTMVSAPAVSVPVLITDAPSDQLLAFSLSIDNIVLKDSAGKVAIVLGTPTIIEVCHLNGIQAPLLTANIPQGTYTSAIITFSNPQITYVTAPGVAPVTITPTLATNSFTFTFPAAFTVSNSNTSLLFDLLAAQSVAISGTTVTVTPTFKVMPVPQASAAPMPGQNGTGMEQRGTVISASGATLVIQPVSGPNITFTTSATTLFQGGGATSLSGLTAGELVEVDFTIQSGGVLLATRVELAPPPPTGQPPINLLSGPVTAVSSGAFKMAVMQTLGPSVMPTAVASSIFTITVNGSTVFASAPQFVSLANLPFTPAFTAANLSPGQTVRVLASTVSGTTATATNVYLVPQTLGGTVTAISTVGSWKAYTLSLPAGSAFATLSGASTVTVYTSAATAPPPPMATGAAPPAIAVASTVRFNGLVFHTGSGFAMVAACSPDGI